MIYNIAGNFEAENSLNLTLMAVVGQHSTFNCQLSTVNIVQLYNNIITNPLHLYNTIFTLLHTQMIFCVLGRLGRGKIKHLGDDMEGKVKEGGMLLPSLCPHCSPICSRGLVSQGQDITASPGFYMHHLLSFF